MDKEYIGALEDKCIQDCPPGCQSLCPLHVDVRKMLEAIQKADFNLARSIYERSVAFPGILSRICDASCRSGCLRGDYGGAIDVPRLEEAAVLFGMKKARKFRILRKRSERVAVVGGGLCGMTAALTLYEKGYDVELFEKSSSLGGCVRSIVLDILTPDIIAEDVSVFDSTAVSIRLNSGRNASELENLIESYDAVLVAWGSGQATRELVADIDTFICRHSGLFAAGSLLRKNYSPSTSMSDGRRAAVSIDRYLQGVSLSAGRDGELPFESCLYTNTETIVPSSVTVPAEGGSFRRDEALTEACRCVLCECMECVSACKLLEHHGSYPKRYVRELSNSVNQFYGVRKTKHMLNGCTDCGLCAELCPNDLSMGELCTMGKRELVERGIMPPAVHDFPIQDMIYSNSEQCSIRIFPEGADSVYFPGCQMQALMPDLLEKSYESILQMSSGRTGLYLGCCGAPADWAGRIPLRDEIIESFRTWWSGCGKPRIIYACTSCRKILANAVDKESLISLWEIFDEKSSENILPATVGEQPRLAIADPCTSRYLPEVRSAARSLFKRQGCEIEELFYSGELTRCCGFGGLVSLTEPEVGRLMVEARINESNEDYGLYCVMCQDNFASEGKSTRHILEVLYGASAHRKPPGSRISYSERQENRRRARESVRRRWASNHALPADDAWENTRLLISEEVAARVEERMILYRDIQRAVFEAELSGRRILNPETEHLIASNKPGVVTYWVEYSLEGEAVRIHNAYSHRLEVME
ncbi:MAG: NAD(P)-binding protein [Spirochaetales bacterium]|nr:NAD(P)-binding protein [Spirochaetales bacterium]